MNFAYHYLCNDINNLKELVRTISVLLRNGGRFIFSFFDGEKIIKKARAGKARIGPFVIQINENNTALMPLPTIDSSGYREEPLVLEQHLALFINNPSFKLIEKYTPFSKISKIPEFLKIQDPCKVSEFLKYITVLVFEKV